MTKKRNNLIEWGAAVLCGLGVNAPFFLHVLGVL